MQMRARGGIKVGDIQKEAHLSFCMALLNENRNNFTETIKFLKRFYFCAKLLDDHEGVEISLNKIGMSFFMANQAEDSLRFHEKHFEFTSKKQYDNDNSKMISLYNQALAVRKI
jgi:hypothetical protein